MSERLIPIQIDLGDLWGSDGNAWSIMSKVVHVMKQLNLPQAAVDTYNSAAMGGDYVNLLHVTDRTVEGMWRDGFEFRPLSEFIEEYEARFNNNEEE